MVDFNSNLISFPMHKLLFREREKSARSQQLLFQISFPVEQVYAYVLLFS